MKTPHETSTEFRPLNQRERNLIFSCATPKPGINPKTGLQYESRIPVGDFRVTDTEELLVSYERMKGGFTVCVLVLKGCDGDLVWRGVSRRSYKDKPNPVRGEMLAFSRAILYSRAVTLSESPFDEGEEEYFMVLSLDGDVPCSIESGKVVEVFSTRKEAEKFISGFISENQSKIRLEILAVRV